MANPNRVEMLHRIIFGGNIAILFAGLGRGTLPISFDVVSFLFVLLVLRVKFWFDDEQYIADVASGHLPGGLPYGFGMGLAFISWFFWYLAGFYVKDLELAALFMTCVMAFSTLWIVAAMVKRGAYQEQIPWLFFNAFYIGGFLLLHLRSSPWNPFSKHLDAYSAAVTMGLAGTFLIDLIVTRILEARRANTQKL
jgi:hypothetical protein